MKRLQKLFKQAYKLAIENYFITIFIAIIMLVGVIIVFKVLTSKDEFVYAKVKVSQGFWWANTLRPSMWLVRSLQKGDSEVSLSGKPTVTIQEVKYYPVANVNSYVDQFDVYLTLRLKVSKNDSTGKYTFKRSTLAVGSPVDFEFKNAQVSATVMALSEKTFKDMYVDKTVTLTRNFVLPTEYDVINVGDEYSDGNSTVFEVVDVSAQESYAVYDATGNNYPVNSARPLNVTIKAKMRLLQNNDNLFFGEEINMIKGKKVTLQTSQYVLEQYLISSIE